MDTQAYIQSGVIEAYVLGLSTAEEAAEVESLRREFPEIEKAIDDFSISLEEQAFGNAVTPPPFIKQNLVNSLDFAKEADDEKAVVVPITANENRQADGLVKKLSFYKMMAAASVILLLVSAAFNYYYADRYNKVSEQNEALLAERSTLQANMDVYRTNLSHYESASAMMADPNMVMVKMDGQAGKDAMATIFWDAQTKDVYLMPNKLPAPAPGKQYQLWALVDGKPVDAGVMDPACTGVCKLKNIPRADAFAVTLEKAGGSPTPDLTQLFVLGKV